MLAPSKMNSDVLYERLLNFAKKSQKLVKKLPKNIYNNEYSSQFIRSSASPGANYIEAIEAISAKDFVHRLRICRKESKESVHWLTLIKSGNPELENIREECNELIDEATQFVRIFSSSILTLERNQQIKK